jgi:hypothetical protein
MKHLIVLFLLFPLYSLTDQEKVNICKNELLDSRVIISKLGEINKKQIEDIYKFIDSGIKNELYYYDDHFTIKQSGSFPVYELLRINGEYRISDKNKYVYNREYTYKFTTKSSLRPYSYTPAIFKLGGVVFYNQDKNQVYPDFTLLFEFLSFDKLLGVYGFSLNISTGLRHIGISLGYQMYNTVLFKNTSIIFGYSHDFVMGFQTPMVGISLNF